MMSWSLSQQIMALQVQHGLSLYTFHISYQFGCEFTVDMSIIVDCACNHSF